MREGMRGTGGWRESETIAMLSVSPLASSLIWGREPQSAPRQQLHLSVPRKWISAWGLYDRSKAFECDGPCRQPCDLSQRRSAHRRSGSGGCHATGMDDDGKCSDGHDI